MRTQTLQDGAEPFRVSVHETATNSPKSEEKGSDVNIACYLLVDAFDADYDAAVVVSNDSDLAEPIHLVRRKFGKPVIVLHPCGSGRKPSNELQKVASKSLMVDAGLLLTCQFPISFIDAAGRTIRKPTSW